MDEAAEREAVARLKAGDVGGLEALVRAHQVRAVRAAYLVTRDPALAEDLVQSAFVRCYERIHQFDAGRRFGPWFVRTVVNDAAKAVARRDRHVSLDHAADGAVSALAELVADPGAGPAECFDQDETRRMVWEALGRLSPAQRAAVVLRFYLGLTEAEIAGQLGCAPGTVKWRLHTARERLRAWLHPLWPGTDSGVPRAGDEIADPSGRTALPPMEAGGKR